VCRLWPIHRVRRLLAAHGRRLIADRLDDQ